MGENVVKTRDLSKRYQNMLAVDGVDMTIEKGQIYGFIGQNGAGKTTFMRLLMGLAAPSGGTIALFGESREQALRKARKRVSFLPAASFTYPSLTVTENLEYFRFCQNLRTRPPEAGCYACSIWKNTKRTKPGSFLPARGNGCIWRWRSWASRSCLCWMNR